jgi:hypothetical protein
MPNSYIGQLIQSVPDAVWSGLIASALTSILTIGGVLISNRSNTNRLKLQLQHDATQKSSERIAALRREVYLRAVEELTKANAYLAYLPQADFTKMNAGKGLQGFFAATAKLQLVAEPKTALLVNQIVAEYNELVLKLLGAVMPLQHLRSDITICSGLYEQAQSEIKRILSEMAKFNESAQTNEAVFRALQKAVSFHQAQAQQYSSERSEHWRNFNKLNAEFCRSFAREMQRLVEMQIPVLIAIRQDLGLTGELDAFKAQMQANADRMTKQIDTLINSLQDGQATSSGPQKSGN